MKNLPLKYQGCAIVFQEVPNEISLAFNISGCPVKCQGCHSKYLWEYKGDYLSDDIETWINKYQSYITCVCFMGGDQNTVELEHLCKLCHSRGLKTCLYTGNRLSDSLISFASKNLDYLKVGEYRDECGSLDKETTNQKMYRIDNKAQMIDVTYLFRKDLK